MIDTHAHLDDPQFDADRDDVLARSLAAGVEGIVCVGTTLESSRVAVRLAENVSPGLRGRGHSSQLVRGGGRGRLGANRRPARSSPRGRVGRNRSGSPLGLRPAGLANRVFPPPSPPGPSSAIGR